MNWKNALLTLLALLMLTGIACAVPSGYITEEAQESYTENFGSDEFDFL